MDVKERWPTTESIARILNVTGVSMGQFSTFIHNTKKESGELNLPKSNLTNLQNVKGFINNQGKIQSDIRENFNEATEIDRSSFMVKIDNSDYLPTYTKGDKLIASINMGIRKKDKVVIAVIGGENIIATIKSMSSHTIKLSPIGDRKLENKEIFTKDILWIARILWKSE